MATTKAKVDARVLKVAMRSLEQEFARQDRLVRSITNRFQRDASLLVTSVTTRSTVFVEPSTELLALIVNARTFGRQLQTIERRLAAKGGRPPKPRKRAGKGRRR